MSNEQQVLNRRRFMTGAAAGAAAASLMITAKTASAAISPQIKRAPLDTKITEMMSANAAKNLTPAARNATKGDLAALRAGVKGIANVPTKTQLSVADIDSIEKAFDDHEFARHRNVGFKTSGLPLGMSVAAADNISACCCCCPCCSTAAAVTRAPAGR